MRRIGAVMRRWKPPSWVLAGRFTSPSCWAVMKRRFAAVGASWMIPRCCRRVASEKKGGRKCCLDSMPTLKEAFVTVVDTYTAGDPMQDGVLWTNLTRPEIAAGLAEHGCPVSVTVVDQLL